MDEQRRIFLPAHSYRREARRLRARHGADPARLYGALRELARTHDAPQAPAPPTPRMRLVIHSDDSSTTPSPPFRNEQAEHQFTAEARSAVQDGMLRYSQRQALLHRAEALGLHRFRANLLLAMALHELNGPLAVTTTRVAPAFEWNPSPTAASDASRRRRLRLIGLLDLLLAAVFAVSIFAGQSVWRPATAWDYLALATGAGVFAVCPLLLWSAKRATSQRI